MHVANQEQHIYGCMSREAFIEEGTHTHCSLGEHCWAGRGFLQATAAGAGSLQRAGGGGRQANPPGLCAAGWIFVYKIDD